MTAPAGPPPHVLQQLKKEEEEREANAEAHAANLSAMEEKLIDARKKVAMSRGDRDELVWYRVLHAATAKLLAGTAMEPPQEATLPEWCEAMKLDSATTAAYGPPPLHLRPGSPAADPAP